MSKDRKEESSLHQSLVVVHYPDRTMIVRVLSEPGSVASFSHYVWIPSLPYSSPIGNDSSRHA